MVKGQLGFSFSFASLSGLPSLFSKTNPSGPQDNHYKRIASVEHENLNLPRNPCNDDPTFSFRACVNMKLSSDIGCRRKWDIHSDQRLPLCTNINQFR